MFALLRHRLEIPRDEFSHGLVDRSAEAPAAPNRTTRHGCGDFILVKEDGLFTLLTEPEPDQCTVAIEARRHAYQLRVSQCSRLERTHAIGAIEPRSAERHQIADGAHGLFFARISTLLDVPAIMHRFRVVIFDSVLQFRPPVP